MGNVYVEDRFMESGETERIRKKESEDGRRVSQTPVSDFDACSGSKMKETVR